MLLQGDKGNFRSLLVALPGVTGVPVSVGEKDRNEVPVGVATQVARDEGNAKNNPDTETTTTATPATAPKVLAPTNTMEAMGTVEVTSDPDGAEVNADGAFVGSCPVTLKLKPGQHTVRVTQSGYAEWSRDIMVQAGSIAHLNAKGEKATVAGTVALESTKVTESGSTPHRSVSTENEPTSPDEPQYKQYWVSKIMRAQATSPPAELFSSGMIKEGVAAIPGQSDVSESATSGLT